MELVVGGVMIFWLVPCFIGKAISERKNRRGGWWGWFLGWCPLLH